MKETDTRALVRELMRQGLTKRQITERVPCDSSHVYRLIAHEELAAGLRPASPDKLSKLEERVRQLEKVVAALASMKRFGGNGVT